MDIDLRGTAFHIQRALILGADRVGFALRFRILLFQFFQRPIYNFAHFFVSILQAGFNMRASALAV